MTYYEGPCWCDTPRGREYKEQHAAMWHKLDGSNFYRDWIGLAELVHNSEYFAHAPRDKCEYCYTIPLRQAAILVMLLVKLNVLNKDKFK